LAGWVTATLDSERNMIVTVWQGAIEGWYEYTHNDCPAYPNCDINHTHDMCNYYKEMTDGN
jgi:hypothetical protein